jgi:SagB-type dehydrogenase family enzyme
MSFHYLKNYSYLFRFPAGSQLQAVGAGTVQIRSSESHLYSMPARNPQALKQILSLLQTGIRVNAKTKSWPRVLTALFAKGSFELELFRGSKKIATAEIEMPVQMDLSKKAWSKPHYWNSFVSLAPAKDGFHLRSTEAISPVWMEVSEAQKMISLTLQKQVAAGDFANPALFALLKALGFLSVKKESPFQKYWEEHDRYLFMSSRRRSLGDLRKIGAIYPFSEVQPTAPAIAAKRSVELPASTAQRLPAVFSQRQSHRISSEKSSLTVQDLSNFLTLLTQQESRADGRSRKIFPIAGNIDSPEFVILNYSCQGLQKGIYFFESQTRKLLFLDENESRAKAHAQLYAHYWSLENGVPPVIVQAIRFYPRIAWKYRGLNLKVQMIEGGGVLQSAQLIATHLGLGCCPLGSGGILFQPEKGKVGMPWDRIPIVEFAIGKEASK